MRYAPIKPLTRRELQIHILLLGPLSLRDIAATVGIAEGTLKTYLHHLYPKFAVGNRIELMSREIREGAK